MHFLIDKNYYSIQPNGFYLCDMSYWYLKSISEAAKLIWFHWVLLMLFVINILIFHTPYSTAFLVEDNADFSKYHFSGFYEYTP